MSESQMTRTVITLPKRTLERLKKVAAERNVSMAALMREALEEKIVKVQPLPTCLGIGDSGRTDLSRRAGEERPEPPAWR